MASVVLFTDEPILAEGLRRILETAADLDLCSYCANVDDLEAELDLHKPELLLLDLTSSIHFSVLVKLQHATIRTKIVLWVHSISTELALQAMSVGVRGVLRKTLPPETLVRCLTRVLDGELWFEKALTDSLMTAQRFRLTRREGQLVSLLSQGMKNKEVATALSISEGTVKVYLSRLYQKLGVKDRFELALFGLKNLTPGGGARNIPAGPSRDTPRSFFVERIVPQEQRGERRLLVNG
jgi:two-component system, NarL family, nitrate/nitrite response regulator NarL